MRRLQLEQIAERLGYLETSAFIVLSIGDVGIAAWASDGRSV
jgi:hypothetical protein